MNDDDQIGYLLTRREALSVLGAAGMMMLAGCKPGESSATTVPSGCVVRPEQTPGPYFVDELLNRADIRADPVSGVVKAGIPLALAFNVTRITANSCTPLAGAMVDLWHCDALGVYSDVNDPGFNTKGEKWLRGYQLTDAGGVARFTTIYPGWYPGRAVHIHFKIRSLAGVSPAYQFTSQLYFEDALNDTVHAQPPYSAKGQREMKNAGDRIYQGGGSQLTLSPTPDAQGYRATFDVALQTG
jgi:protocatechuate 3,4-dioxygenase beta subunit